MDRMIPGSVFARVGVDYAGPLLIKCGSTRKPVLVKAYICVFVCFSVKAVHMELVSDLTTDSFIAALRRFIARRVSEYCTCQKIRPGGTGRAGRAMARPKF